jgi:hypothetical protein
MGASARARRRPPATLMAAPWVAALLIGLLVSACSSGATAAPSPSPSPSPVSSPTAPSSPSPTPAPSAIDVAAAFIKALANPGLSAKLEVTGTLTLGKLEFPVTGAMSVQGHDSQSSMTIGVPGAPQVAESVRVGGESYARAAPGPWLRKGTESSDASLSDALAGLLNASDAGVVTKNGRQLHHIVPAAGFSIPPSALGMTNPAIRNPTVTIDFYADDNGQPAIMAIAAGWTQAVGAQTLPVTMLLDMAFQDFGTVITIEAPSDVWTTFTSKRFGYSVAHPSDWTVDEAESDDEYGPAGQRVVFVAPQDVGAITLGTFRDGLVASYKTQLGVAKPESDTETKIGGQEARLITYHFTNEAGQKLVVYDTLTLRDGKGWEVFLLDLAGNEGADKAVSDAFVATFAFTK